MGSDHDFRTMPDGGAALHRHRFGAAEFDEASLELHIGGLQVELQRKPLQILALLLASPGEVVSKERLFAEVWNHRASGDAVLANAISKLRAALGEELGARLVTVPRQGFRLEGPVERVVTGRRLVSRMRLTAGEVAPGREPGWVLTELLGLSEGHETWLIVREGSRERRVRKFALNGEDLASLKREVTLGRALNDALPGADCFVPVLAWNFEFLPCWIETPWCGENLAQWAEGGARLALLGPEQRLALALQITAAVALAHDGGVLHKDLKPSNVLIEARGAGWHVRLGDFGIGQFVDATQLERLQITRLGFTRGAQSAPPDSGTALYLAPELLAGQSPSVRSDLYALGVMLVQLLTGDLRRPLAPGWERSIDDELLRQDLALSTDVDPKRRFASVTELEQRLRTLGERHAALDRERTQVARLQHEREALERWRVRRPWAIGAALALLLGIGLSLWLYGRAQQSATRLAAELQTSDALNRLLREDLIGAANPAQQGRADITVADALARAAGRIDTRFATQSPRVRAQLHGAVQVALSELSRSKEAVDAGRRALAAWAEARDIDRDELQQVRLRYAVDLVQVSDLDQATQVVRDIERDQAGRRWSPDMQARLLYAKSWVTGGQFALQESTSYLESARQLLEGLDESQAPWRDKILFALADSYSMLGRNAESETLLRNLHADQVRRLGRTHVRPAYTLVGLGRSLLNQNKLDDATQVLEEAARQLESSLGRTHRMTLTARDQLATVHYRAHRYAEAAGQWHEVRTGFTTLLGADSSYTITIATNEAQALQQLGQVRQAVLLLRDSLSRVKAIVAMDSPQAQQIRYTLADCLLMLRQPAEVPALVQGLDPQSLNLAQQESDWPQRLELLQTRLTALRSADHT